MSPHWLWFWPLVVGVVLGGYLNRCEGYRFRSALLVGLVAAVLTFAWMAIGVAL